MFRLILLSCLLVSILSLPIFAQTTVFNAPTTDVVSEKGFYIEGNFTAHFDKLIKGGYQNYGYKTIYGLRKKVEVGANFYYTRSSSPAVKEFQANAKWKVYENEKRGFAVATGTQIFVPLRNAAGGKTFSMFYSNASKIIPKANGLRLTGGYYRLVGVNQSFGSKSGAIVAIEQPITSRFNLIADWYSGKNRFGYLFGGFSLFVTKKQSLYAGYNFGNIGRGNNSFGLSYGINY